MGCLVGGAVGDALGYLVEFDSWPQIEQRFGPSGVTEMAHNKVSDDTQMTLFTAEGLLEALEGTEFESVRRAYLRWFDTQTKPMPPAGARGLAALPWLYERRAPGNACISSLAHGGERGADPDSKGCGTVMRSAPFGLLASSPARAYDLARQCAAITHGHPTAGAAAGAFAMMVFHLVEGETVQKAVSHTMLHLRQSLDRSETADALQRAFELAGNVPPAPNSCARLGEGWVAEEALAIAVYCLLGTGDVRAALVAAVSHGGDSDSTGAILGNLLGAAYGYAAVPADWAAHVEGRGTIADLAARIGAARR
nr:ADP-ribosylglycohydrolase family protein [Glycomyces sp. L485]